MSWPVTRGPGLDVAKRHDALRLYAFTWARRLDLKAADAPQVDLDEVEQLAQLAEQEYVEALPFVAVARCPFTGEVAYHSLDHAGIDGLWWDSESPARPREQLPPTWLVLAGAMQLGAPPPPRVPLDVRPGPGVPYVVRRLIEEPTVQAVVSAVKVGPHTGFPITYFSSEPLPDVRLVNRWGAQTYTLVGSDGRSHEDQVFSSKADNEYDLAPWLDSGKLRWIDPGDESLELRSGSKGCPFVGLTGPHEYQGIYQGTVALLG